jgi:hypothetical protein
MNNSPLNRSSTIWRAIIIWVLFIAFLVAFRSDVMPAIRGWWDLVLILFNRKEPPVDSILLPSMFRIAVNVMVYIGMFLISAFVIAQFILPVRAWKDRRKAFYRLLMYSTRWTRGPAVFVHNGQLVKRIGEEDNTNPGVIVADMRSAVVVEQEYPYLGDPDDAYEHPMMEKENSIERYGGLWRTLRFFNPKEKESIMARALGPGIQFTDWGEKVRMTLDLRRQVRIVLGEPIVTPDGKKIPQAGVKAFTRDGIEVGANCYTVFSLSDPPDIIPIGYWRGTDAKNLCELEFGETNETNLPVLKNVYPLDREDAEEIHQAVISALIVQENHAATSVCPQDPYRYSFDKDRVFAAAYGQAYHASPNDKSQWHELPLVIAADIFRNLLEKYNFDYLYSVDNPDSLPWMDEFKPEFARRVKYQGILSYQLVRPANLPRPQNIYWKWRLDDESNPQHIKLNEPFQKNQLEYSAPRSLTGPKSLRDRGIKIVATGFSEIKIPPEIREKMAERWKARWEREIQIVMARQEREATQIISSARNRAQRDNAYFLSNLFKEEKHSTEALALMVFQSLEHAATDMKNQKDLPPKEVMAMLQNLHNWLLRERQEIMARKKPPKGPDSGEQSIPPKQ